MASYLVGSKADVEAFAAEFDALLGYPRIATNADRFGGGIFAPLEQCVTLRHSEPEQLKTGKLAYRVDPKLAAEIAKGSVTVPAVVAERAVLDNEKVAPAAPGAVEATEDDLDPK